MHKSLILIFVFISNIIFGQEPAITWEVPGKSLEFIGDLDGNGKAEFYSSTSQSSFEIYEYQSAIVKWTIVGGIIDSYHLPDYDRTLMYRDFNNNNVIDIVISSDNQLKLIDPSTGDSIFAALPGQIRFIDDFDNDGIIDFQLRYRVDNENWGELFYSTGIAGSNLEGENKLKEKKFSLSQNYPNPFNPATTIDYYINKGDNVKLNIYDSLGKLVKNLVDEYIQPGEYKVVWDGRNNNGMRVSSGIYFYQIITENFVGSKKMILLK